MRSAWWADPVLHLQLLLAVAFFFGGGGSTYALFNAAVQLAAIACLAAHPGRAMHFFRHGPRLLVALVSLSVAVPLLQMIPLPPTLWQSLPGRDLVTAAWQAAGIATEAWAPVSMTPGRTMVALAGTFAPAAIIIIASSFDRAQMARLGWAFVALALVSLLAGVAQLSTANTRLLPYAEGPEPDVLYGLFANRNSHGVMMVGALALIAVLPGFARLQPAMDTALRCGAGALLAVGVVLTKSRTSMVLLLVVVLAIAALQLWRMLAARGKAKTVAGPPLWIGLATAALVLVAMAGSLITGGRVATSLERFQITQSDRPEMWEDGIYAARHYWPVGSGTGTFEDVFQVDESLEYVSPRRAGRAHNDFIEVTIESGIVGMVMLLCWAGWIGWNALRAGPGDDRALRLFGGLIVLAMAGQSLLDFPLRNQINLCLFAVVVALLVPRRAPENGQ